jgi:hypothetical protein
LRDNLNSENGITKKHAKCRKDKNVGYREMGIKELKVELEMLDKRRLIELISEMYRKEKNVQKFLDYYLSPDESRLFEEHKARIREGFFPKKGDALKLSLSRQAINNFKKYEPSKELIADLMLCYVECGVEFTNDYGDINESFYTSVEGMYYSALDLMSRECCLEKFKERAAKIVHDTKGIGWGFHDGLADIYFEYYE